MIDSEILGWIVSNNDRGETVIQRHDETGRFDGDEQATEFVGKTFMEMLEVMENTVSLPDEFVCPSAKNYIRKMIAKVKGK